MKEFFSEYGFTIVECIGASILISMLLYFVFGGSLSEVLSNFVGRMIGG